MAEPTERLIRDDEASPSTRAYRLQKRRRPCDQCRERKLRCQATDERPPCPRCAQSQVKCTYRGKPSERARTPRLSRQRLPSQSRTEGSPPASGIAEHPQRNPYNVDLPGGHDTGLDPGKQLVTPSSNLRNELLDNTPGSNAHVSDLSPLHGQTSHQYLQTLDDLQDQTAVLLGPSSESDPWLFRHARFDEYGQRSFHVQQHFRNIGGVPTTEKIPVHFFVAQNSLCDGKASGATIMKRDHLRIRLSELITPKLGVRLVRL